MMRRGLEIPRGDAELSPGWGYAPHVLQETRR